MEERCAICSKELDVVDSVHCNRCGASFHLTPNEGEPPCGIYLFRRTGYCALVFFCANCASQLSPVPAQQASCLIPETGEEVKEKD